MNYQSILNRIEDEKKDEVLSAKLFRYTGLMQAIEFFSQKLVFDQIIDAAFDFINELLLIDHSAIYIVDSDGYIPKKVKGFNAIHSRMENTEKMKELATFYGTILYEKGSMTRFFDTKLIDTLNINAIVPLITEFKLYGFILISSKPMNEDDYIISEALMKLINTALENFSRYEELAKMNNSLDEKVFNLYAINQSSKVLLSELNLDTLYNVSVDVFSELTHSTITGFILFDESSNKYEVKGFKDVYYNLKDINVGLVLDPSAQIDGNKVILDLSNEEDIYYFNTLFNGGLGQLEQLNSKYIVFILKNAQIFGFVSLSETVTGRRHGEGIFELIESLASSTYTALSNAKLFTQVNNQKKIIQNKLDKMISLNKLTKNINSSVKPATLMDLAADTLKLSFNVETGLLCYYNKSNDTFEVAKTININERDIPKSLSPNKMWKRVFEGDTVFENGEQAVVDYFGEGFKPIITEAQGVLIVPLYIDILEPELVGCIIIFKFEDSQLSDEENIITIETIAGHIAPVLNNLATLQQQQKFMLPNFIELFKQDLEIEIAAALEYSMNLTVVQIVDDRGFGFKGNVIIDSLKNNFKKIYPFSHNNIFIIENDTDGTIEKRIIDITGSDKLKLNKSILGKDFANFAQFFELYR